jgi:bleomycin hydrolase
MKKAIWIVLILFVQTEIQVFAQDSRRDKGLMVEPKNEFMDSIKKTIEQFNKKDEPAKKSFKLDFGSIKAPSSPAEFTQYWHNPPISQAMTNTCWCFSTTSFLESEIYRLTQRKLKLSEMHTVYWEYVEKTRRFIRERGNSAFGEGSESNAVTRIWKTYGVVPEESFTGLKPGQVFHDHTAMYKEMNSFLQSVKTTDNWNEDAAIATIRSIMNHYLGEPPAFVVVDGKKLTPKEYLEKVVRLNPDDYVDVLSLMEKPFHQFVEYETEDNWWHSQEYYNVPVDEFLTAIKRAVRNGYTVCLGGDVSEAGIDGHAGLAVVPTFDISPVYIDDSAREFRFNNGITVDDHGIHVVGFKEMDGKDWYLIKDSGSSSRNNDHPGYYFYHEDYVKLKMLDFMVHKNAIGQLFESDGTPNTKK